MNVDEFIQALAGGALIGLAGGLLLLIQGRILGVSGILSQSIISPLQSDWRIWFLLGLVVTPVIVGTMFTDSVHIDRLSIGLPDTMSLDTWQVIVGALLVGLGTKMGSGCTSGHGVCGIGRLSVRSIVATMLFMLTAMVTVFVIRHVLV